jgi:hypothetical protein
MTKTKNEEEYSLPPFFNQAQVLLEVRVKC